MSIPHPFRFSFTSDEVSSCWDSVIKLLHKEHESNTTNTIKQLKKQRDKMCRPLNAKAYSGKAFKDVLGNINDRMESTMRIQNWIREMIKRACEAYNAAVCRCVCLKLSEKLPRELRDMIYQHLTSGKVIICVDSTHCGRAFVGCEQFKAGARPYVPEIARSKHDHLCSSHFWREDVVGRGPAVELVESWYRHSDFVITKHDPFASPIELFHGLNTLLNNDRFGMNFRPRTLISSITQDLLVFTMYPGGEDQYDPVIWFLEELFQLKFQASIHLRLARIGSYHPMGSMGWEREVDTLMQCIYPTLLRLHRAKYRLSMSLRGGYDGEASEHVLRAWLEKLDYES